MQTMPGFSFFVTLLMGLGAWSVHRLSASLVMAGLAAGLVVSATGIGIESTSLVAVGVAVGAVCLGVVVGRTVPYRSAPMALLLGLLSAIDIIWVASGGRLATDWVNEVLNFSVQLGTGSSSIGTLDLLLASALSAHWSKRGASLALSVAAAPLGMVISNVYVAMSGADNLPLVPFIGLGWLITESLHRRSEKQQPA